MNDIYDIFCYLPAYDTQVLMINGEVTIAKKNV